MLRYPLSLLNILLFYRSSLSRGGFKLKHFYLIFLFVSCSSYRQLEFINENMSRFKDESSTSKNLIPKIVSLPLALPSRSPASVGPKKSQHPNLNNKQLYFLTLNDQFHQMGRLLKVEKIMSKRCPHFHSLHSEIVNKNITIKNKIFFIFL